MLATSSRARRKKSRGQGRPGNPRPATEAIVTVSTLGRHGHGIAEAETGRLFIPYSLPTETIRAKITGDRGEIIEIIEAASNRADPVCPHFGECGGCAVQHLQEAAYHEWKRGIVATALRHQGLDVDAEPIIDAHGEGRRRVTLHVRRHGSHVQVGFMQAKSHRLSNIQVCPVFVPAFSEAIDLACRLGDCLDAPVHGPSHGLDVQLTASETGLDCNVIGISANGYEQHMALVDIAEKYDLARLALDGEIIAERRKPHLRIGMAQVRLPVGGFLQATEEGERVLSGLVRDYVTASGAQSGADLFCGIGSYALRLADHVRILAADSNAMSIEALASAVRYTQNLKPVETVVRDLFDNPLSAEELAAFDFVVFNPPRAGASAQVAEIALSQAPNVIAVSCDPSTFARDARILVDGGYTLERVTPVDQFKWAAHVEIVGVFRRL